MLEAVYQIGKSLPKKSFLEDYIDSIGANYKHVFKIVFDISKYPEVKYSGIGYEDYDSSKKMQYFYKGKKGNAKDFTPTSKIVTLNKTFKNKISGSIAEFIKNNRASLVNLNFLENLDEVLNNNSIEENKIYQDLFDHLKNHDLLKYEKKEDDYSILDGGIITLFFADKSQNYYVGELKDFKEVIDKQGKQNYSDYYYSKSYKVESIGNDKYCSFCNQKQDEVWGFVNTYNFYTLDKLGMTTGGFKREHAWKNYPVCYECALILKKGRTYIDNLDSGLKNIFCSFQYMLIPELVYDDKNLLTNVLGRIKEYKKFWIDQGGIKGGEIVNQEVQILKELSKEKNYVNFNFLFYAINSSEFKILLNLKDIAPSFIFKLMKTKDIVDEVGDKYKRKYDIFKEIETKTKETIFFDFSFHQIRLFFPNTKMEGNFDKTFLEIINNIFLSKNISFSLLISAFMKKIREGFVKGNSTFIQSKHAYKIIIYLEALGILDKRRFKLSVKTEAYKEFFDENQILDSNTSRSVFLLGVLSKKLLNWQKREKNGATPFMSRLNGLKIDQKTIMRLLPEIVNKLEEYHKNYYKELEQGISHYMLNANFNEFSIDELSFYFVLGMNLADLFHKENDDEISEEELNNE